MTLRQGKLNHNQPSERGAFGQCVPMRSTGTSVCNFAICNLHFSFFILLALNACFAFPSSATAEQAKIVGVRVGVADRYKAGLWTPVEVTFSGGDEEIEGRLTVVAPDGDGVPGRVSTPCRLPAGRETKIRLITRIGRVRGEITVELKADGRAALRRTFQTATRADGEHFLPGIEFRKLFVVVGKSDLGLEAAGKLGGGKADYQPVVARVDDVAQLPSHWYGYEGIDAVVFSTSRPEAYRMLDEEGRAEALSQWIELGGRLVICAGAGAERLIGEGAPLSRFLPGKYEKTISLRQTGALEIFVGSRDAILQSGEGRNALDSPRLSGISGKIELSEADLPLIARQARGFGQVVFLAGDPDSPPLDRWPARPLLAAKLLDMPVAASDDSSRQSGAMMHYGYRDMSGQLRSALDQYEGVRLTPFWLIAVLIAVYILLIGPGDYFFLRKLVGRMQYTWLTFPLIVVAAGAGALLLAYWFKGDELRVNQIDLVDVDIESGLTRGASWANVYSPRTETFDFSVRPRASDARTLVGWLGLPGGGLGGMSSRTEAPLLWTEGFRYANDYDALLGMPVQVWSSKSLTARWEAPAASAPTAKLSVDNRTLVGRITNTLDFPLENCLLAFDRSAYKLGTLQPGKSARFGPLTRRSELKTYLTGRRTVKADKDSYRHESTPYDLASTDLVYILRTMMFYDEAGGYRYTGLWNDYQDFVDLSGLLNAGRAILIAEAPSENADARGAELFDDGRPLAVPKDKHRTIYRFVFPVEEGKSG